MGDHLQEERRIVQTALQYMIRLERIVKAHPEVMLMGDVDGRTPAHIICGNSTTKGFIEGIIDLSPSKALSMINSKGNTPLHCAASRQDMPPEAIEMLVDKSPETAQIMCNNGWTPLHVACRYSSMHVVRSVAPKYTEAARMKTSNGGDLPLHCLVMRGPVATIKEVKLLLKYYPGGLTSSTERGYTPIHIACRRGCTARVIQLLLDQGPKAIQMVDDKGLTVLHSACYGKVPIEILCCLIKSWYVACLFVRRKGRDWCLPFDDAVDNNEPDIVECIVEATKDAVGAMLEHALATRSALPEAATNHLRQTIAAAIPELLPGSLSGPALTAAIRPHLTPELVKTLTNNNDLQTLLKEDEDYRNLLCAIVDMNKSGRNYIAQVSACSNKKKGVCVLESVSNSVDCLLLHMRENPSLCSRVLEP
jgi:hypothetical protein